MKTSLVALALGAFLTTGLAAAETPRPNIVYTIVRPGAPWGLPLAERMLPQALRATEFDSTRR